MGRIRVYALKGTQRSAGHPQRAELKGPAPGHDRPAQKPPQKRALRLRLTLTPNTVRAGTSPRATVDFVNGFKEPITIVSPELHGTDFNHREPGEAMWLETTLVLLRDGTEVNGITASGHGRWKDRMDEHLVHIKPGDRYTVTFPTIRRWELTEMLDTPGSYEINVSYLLDPEQPDIKVLPKEDVLWTGLVSSNTVPLTITKKEK
jgi:hypothetical protein